MTTIASFLLGAFILKAVFLEGSSAMELKSGGANFNPRDTRRISALAQKYRSMVFGCPGLDPGDANITCRHEKLESKLGQGVDCAEKVPLHTKAFFLNCQPGYGLVEEYQIITCKFPGKWDNDVFTCDEKPTEPPTTTLKTIIKTVTNKTTTTTKKPLTTIKTTIKPTNGSTTKLSTTTAANSSAINTSGVTTVTSGITSATSVTGTTAATAATTAATAATAAATATAATAAAAVATTATFTTAATAANAATAATDTTILATTTLDTTATTTSTTIATTAGTTTTTTGTTTGTTTTTSGTTTGTTTTATTTSTTTGTTTGTTTTGTTTTTAVPIPTNYENVTGVGVIKKSNVSMKWSDALADCLKDGAILLSIDNPARVTLGVDYVSNTLAAATASNDRDMYTGLTGMMGNWKNAKGVSIDTITGFKWSPGRPIASTVCAVWNHNNHCHWDMILGDCGTNKLPFICEKLHVV